MCPDVKRDYHSQLRAAQAQQTRRAVVAAASELFAEQGYGATTIEAVAAAARVSRKTVFSSVGGKLELLKTALDWAVGGDDQDVALIDRAALRDLLTHDDPARLLRGWAAVLTEIDARVGPLIGALEAAAGVEDDARRLLAEFQRQRLAGARTIVRRMRELGAVETGLSRDAAVDIAWLAADPLLYDRLVRLRGWSAARFEKWLGQFLLSELTGR